MAFLATGLSMINYGLGTPSSNGVAIAICGSMIAMVAAVVRGLCLSGKTVFFERDRLKRLLTNK